MKLFFCLTTIFALSGSGIYAQATQPPINAPLTGLSPIQQSALDEARAFTRTAKLWRKSIDCQETDSSTSEIAAHIQKTLGANDPIIEVRGKDNNHSTFALQQTQVGPLLSSVAELAGYNVYVLPGRLLICREDALTEDEHAAIKRFLGGEWRKSSAVGYGWNINIALEEAIARIVTDDVRERLTAKGQTLPEPPPETPVAQISGADFTPSYQLPFGELNPSSQQLLQELTNDQFHAFFSNSLKDAPPVLAPDVAVCIHDISTVHGTVFFRTPQTVAGKQSVEFYSWRINH